MSNVNNLTSKDIDEVWSNYKQALTELTSFEQQTTVKKKDIIIRLRDSVEFLVEAGKIPIKRCEISSYVRARLNEYGITYSPGHWHELFLPEQKLERTNNSSPYGDHQHSFEPELNPSNCSCGALQYNGLIYELEQTEEPQSNSQKNDTQKKEKPDPYTNKTTEYYQRIADNCQFLASIANDLVDKYYQERSIADILEGFPTDLQEQKDLEAELIYISKLTDMRQKVGKFEKIKALLLEKCMFNIAKVAKLIDITPKHLSANVIGKEKDSLIKKLEWFRSIEIKCSCGKVNTKEIAGWFNHQYERNELDLPLQEGIFV